MCCAHTHCTRDWNAGENLKCIFLSWLLGQGRPVHLRRPQAGAATGAGAGAATGAGAGAATGAGAGAGAGAGGSGSGRKRGRQCQ